MKDHDYAHLAYNFYSQNKQELHPLKGMVWSNYDYWDRPLVIPHW